MRCKKGPDLNSCNITLHQKCFKADPRKELQNVHGTSWDHDGNESCSSVEKEAKAMATSRTAQTASDFFVSAQVPSPESLQGQVLPTR